MPTLRRLSFLALVLAACDPLTQPAGDPGTYGAHDLVVARALLEPDLAGSRLFVPRPLLDSVAVAVARLRAVDDLITEELGPGTRHDVGTQVVLMVTASAPGGDALIDRLAACPEKEPFAISCWPELEEAIGGVTGISAEYWAPWAGYTTLTLRLPPTVERVTFAERIQPDLAPTGVIVNALITGTNPPRLDRSDPVWRFRFERGYGDCPAGCIFRRVYEYRYDPVSGNAWKSGESGDPYPPPG